MSASTSPTKRKTRPRKQNKKNNNTNMQRKTSSDHKRSKKRRRKRKKNQKGLFKTNLSWMVALILFCVLSGLAYYWQIIPDLNLFESSSSSSSPTEGKPKSHKRRDIVRNFDGVTLKYDHEYCTKNKHLVQSKEDTSPPAPFLFKAKVLRSWNHDTSDFTQGLELLEIARDGTITLMESTGLYKESKLKAFVLSPDGENTRNIPVVSKSMAMEDMDFGEGCTVFFDHDSRTKSIYQLTWKEGKAFVYDMEFNLLRTLKIPKEMKEGWGLYYDYPSGQFIATDGSNQLYFIDEHDFTVTKQFTVKYMNNDREGKDHKQIALKNLNEIEMVNGWILANVWYNTNIYIISPHNGFVYGIIECWKIFPAEVKRQNQRHAVLNGIAYDYVNNQLLITGKNWPKIFAIEVPQFMMDKSA